ncbi:hypothetical protein [Rhodococcoides fascians]|nr:hypothetical protein [Rhodococcus fascians]
MKQLFDFASAGTYSDIADDAPAGDVIVRTGSGGSSSTLQVLRGAIPR